MERQRQASRDFGASYAENSSVMVQKKQEIQGKPICPECGKPMHLYKIEGEIIRFRCSGYPVCKTFRKFKITEED